MAAPVVPRPPFRPQDDPTHRQPRRVTAPSTLRDGRTTGLVALGTCSPTRSPVLSSGPSAPRDPGAQTWVLALGSENPWGEKSGRSARGGVPRDSRRPRYPRAQFGGADGQLRRGNRLNTLAFRWGARRSRGPPTPLLCRGPASCAPLGRPWGCGARRRRGGCGFTNHISRRAPAPSWQLPSNAREFNPSINRREARIWGSAGEAGAVVGESLGGGSPHGARRGRGPPRMGHGARPGGGCVQGWPCGEPRRVPDFCSESA